MSNALTWKEWREAIEERLRAAGFENLDEAPIVSIDLSCHDIRCDTHHTVNNGDGTVDLWG